MYYLSIHACAQIKIRSANKEITRNYQQISPLAHVHKLMCSWTKKFAPQTVKGLGPKSARVTKLVGACSPGHWSTSQVQKAAGRVFLRSKTKRFFSNHPFNFYINENWANEITKGKRKEEKKMKMTRKIKKWNFIFPKFSRGAAPPEPRAYLVRAFGAHPTSLRSDCY